MHAWTGRGGADLAVTSSQGLLRWVLIELLGRSAVPLLGVISGWLAVGSVGKRSYGSFLAGRAQSILLPMVLWNLLALAAVSAAAYGGLITGSIPHGWGALLNELFCLGAPSQINVQMPFLRDLFVCMAVAPVLVRLSPRVLLAVAMAAAVWAVSGATFPLLLRPSILLFFVVGMIARECGLERQVAAKPLWALAVPYLVVALAALWVEVSATGRAPPPAWLTASLDLLLRFAAAGFFWGVAWRLVSTAAGAMLLKAEPYAFLMFCAHLIMIWLGGPWIGRITGPLGSPLYPVFLLAQPFLVLAATVGLGQLLVSSAPAAARRLSGGRLRPAVVMPAGAA